MKKFASVIILFVMIFTMSACSEKANDEMVNSTSTTTTTTSTTKAETTEETTKEETTTEQSEQKTTTAKSNTNTANETTTSKKQETTTKANSSSKPQTTTKKETTTKKPTTTKPNTTAPAKHDHSGLTGNMGKWFNSRAEVNDYYNSVVDYWVNKRKNGEISGETLAKNCPYGYECWSCAECGKWTGNFYYH